MKKLVILMVMVLGMSEANANLRIAARHIASKVVDRCAQFQERVKHFHPKGHFAQAPNITQAVKVFGLPDRVVIDRMHPHLVALIYERKAGWDVFSNDPIPQQSSNGDVCGVLIANGTVKDVEWK